jgi:hypothetical protein
VPPHAIAPYYRQPVYLAPPFPSSRIEGRVLGSLLASTIGLLLDLIGLLSVGAAFAFQVADFLNGLSLGVPALVLGPLGYFLGKSAVGRIAESQSALGGKGSAVAGWVIGIVATALGAAATLTLLVLVLLSVFGTPPT